jgi:hypothetical protein
VRGLDAFHRLRQWVLNHPGVRVHDAHLTLAHPRNRRSPGNDEHALLSCPSTLAVAFRQVAFVTQSRGEPWQVRKIASLSGRLHGDA